MENAGPAFQQTGAADETPAILIAQTNTTIAGAPVNINVDESKNTFQREAMKTGNEFKKKRGTKKKKVAVQKVAEKKPEIILTDHSIWVFKAVEVIEKT